MNNTEYAVTAHNLTKIYGKKAAVSHLEMKVRHGDIYGFIGRNGAGKSTTLKMLCGLVHPTEGTYSLYGRGSSDPTIYRRVGMLIENAGLFPHLDARDNMLLKAKAMGLTDLSPVDELLKLMKLDDTGRKKTRQFSMGMKQRLGIAMALMGNPDLLILDEPTNGLDPEGIREIRCLLQKLNEQGKTIIISSHILGELSKLANCYGIIKDGEMVRQLSQEELDEECRDYLMLEVEQTEQACAMLSEKLPQISYEVFGQHQIRLYDMIDSGAVTTLLVQNGITVNTCSLHQTDLEQYFLNVMEGENKNA